ncbi:MAG: hypothetical protein JSW01_05310 [Candidatus Bathyarchaeota archaeon]|nr:MAG: hypothetical protein JSW01_05310 [Candidatus Bathyarchaeota archaeon]
MNKGRDQQTEDLKALEDEEDTRRLADLRQSLQERIGALENELDDLRTLLTLLDKRLGQVSFKKARIPEPSEEPPRVKFEYERVVPLKTTSGTLLAEMQIGQEDLRVIPSNEVKLSRDIPPFESFMVKRIFEEMMKRDEEDEKKEKLSPDMRFSYEVRESEDGMIEEIRIKNYRTDRRLRELRTSLRWTLEKMYEKVYSQS